MIRLILGKIHGKTTTYGFEFIVDILVESKSQKHEFVQVFHKDYEFVLCQIIELIKDNQKTIAKCNIIGYNDKLTGNIKSIRTPFVPGTEVLLAEDDFIQDILKVNMNKGAFVGKLEHRNVPIYLNINKLVTKHVSILAKTGAGKSYTVGVLIEEMLDKGIPLLIIDPHGEYSSLKEQNTDPFQIEKMAHFNIQSKTYLTQIQEYGDININKDVKPLKLNDNFTPQELIKLFPRLTSTQQSILYSTIQDLDIVNFENLTEKLRFVDNNAKFTILSIIDYLKKTDVFSMFPTDYNELVLVGKASIINLKGIEPEIQQIIIYKLLKDLFQLRKENKISPFFCILEEAHNFIPEKHIGEAKSSSIIRTVASEGRKFGMGLCVVSQRPALIEKNVLSQCNTQIILKVTNPNDLKAISNSAEGLSYNAEDDIRNLPVGTAMVTGFVEMPLFVNIRPRKSKHGGTSIELIKDKPEVRVLIEEVAENVVEEVKEESGEEVIETKEIFEDVSNVITEHESKISEPIHEDFLSDSLDDLKPEKEIFLTLDQFQEEAADKSIPKLRLNQLETDKFEEKEEDKFEDKTTFEEKEEGKFEEKTTFEEKEEAIHDEEIVANEVFEEVNNNNNNNNNNSPDYLINDNGINLVDNKDIDDNKTIDDNNTLGNSKAVYDNKAVNKDIVDEVKEYQELLPLIKPKLTKKDLKLISSELIQRIDTVLIPAALIKCRRKDHEFNLLVNLFDGKLIEHVDKMKSINILDLSKFSVAEVQVLETSLHLYTFTESMVTNKTGLGIVKVQNILNLFFSEDILDKKQEFYTISHDVTLISHPQDYAYNEDIKYESIEFTEKEEKVKSVDDIKNKLNQFIDIVDVKECFVVKYEVIN